MRAEELRDVAAEVKAVTRRRSATLPDATAWLSLTTAALYGSGLMLRVTEAAQDISPATVIESLRQLTIAPAGDETRAALLPVLEAALAGDLNAYRAGLRVLGPPTHALILARASRWCGGPHDFHPILDHVLSGDPAERARRTLKRACGWQLVVLAAHATMLAADDLLRWSAFVDGEALKMHGHYTTERCLAEPLLHHPCPRSMAVVSGRVRAA